MNDANDAKLMELSESKLRRFLAKSESWKRQANRLLAAGYAQVDGKGLTPILFEKPESETLYLIRATIGGVDASTYQIEIVDDSEIIPANDDVLYLLASQVPKNRKRAAYAWAFARLSDKPDVFTVRDAAEHLGVSQVTIKNASSRPGVKNPLKSSLNINAKRHFFSEEDILLWNLRRGRHNGRSGRRPSKNHLEYKTLYTAGKENLQHKIALMLEQGDLSVQDFRNVFRQITGRSAPDSMDPDVLSCTPCERIDLVKVLAEIGKQYA